MIGIDLEPAADLIAAIDEQARRLEASVAAGESEAVQRLIDGGFEVLDQGYTFAVSPILDALERLDAAGALSERERGWYANLRGRLQHQTGRAREAEVTYRSALSIAEVANERHLLATTLMNLGIAIWDAGRADEALKHLESSLEMRPRADAHGRAQNLVNLAGLHLELGHVDKSRKAIKKLLRTDAVRSTPTLYSSTRGIQGLLAAAEGDLAEAETAFRESARIARTAEAWMHLLPAMQNIGSVNLDAGRPGIASRWLRRAERAARVTGDFRALESVQRTLATALTRSRRFADARRLLEKARAEAADHGEQAAWARLTGDLGSLELLRGKANTAADLLDQAAQAFMEHGDTDAAIATTHGLARALVADARVRDAHDAVTRVLANLDTDAIVRAEVLESFADLLLEASAETAAEGVYREVVQLVMAYQDPNAAERLAAIGAKLLQAEAWSSAADVLTRALENVTDASAGVSSYQIRNDRALALINMGRPTEATEDLERAIEESARADDRAMRAVALGNLSEAVRRAGRIEEAGRIADQAIDAAREIGGPEIARALTMRGLAAAANERWHEAVSAHREALQLARQLRDKATQAVALGGLAQANFGLLRYRRARQFYERAADLERSLGDRHHEAESRVALSETYAVLGDASAFQKQVQRLVDLVQKEGVPLEHVVLGLGRAGGAWLRKSHVQEAADTFLAAIILALGEMTDDEEPFREAVARALIAPFIYTNLLDDTKTTQVERILVRRLRGRFGRAADPLIELLSDAREAALDVSARGGV